MTKEDILEGASDIALKANGLDDAIIGLTQYGLIIYDYNKCIDIFMKEFGYSELESKNMYEFLKKLLDYNINTRYSANNLINDKWLNN